VIETTRRLVLTAVLSVCSPGTSQQTVFSLLLALLFVKLYAYYQPYTSNREDILAETGQYQILFTFIGALIMQNDLLGDAYNGTVGFFLVLINLGVFYLSSHFTFLEIKEEKEELDREVEAELEGNEGGGGGGGGDVESDMHDGHVSTAADGTAAKKTHHHHFSKQSHSAVQSSNALKKATLRRKSVTTEEHVPEEVEASPLDKGEGEGDDRDAALEKERKLEEI
jgi:hypothetical protein